MKNGKILVVDDNDDHRDAIQFLLEKEGYSVIPAENGDTGFAKLKKRDDIQVLITDLAMLKGSGVQLLEKIKDRKQPLRRIVLTAYDEELPYDQAEELHVFAYLNKPISKTTLIFTVKSAFSDLHLEEAQKWEELGQAAIDFVKLLGKKVITIPRHIASIREELNTTPESVQFKFKQINKIINQIVNLQRVLLTPFEKTTLDNVNVKEIVDLCIDLIEISEDVKVVKNYGQEEHIAYSNSFSLQKVLEDVIRNAIDAMQVVETKVLTISIPDGSGATVQITIHDTGCGISEEKKDKIFRPFYTTKEEENYGLGLFCAKGTITNLGGTITFESNKKDGTSFVINLPITKKED
jgi:signal transduction histidine kinase